ncbi:MAG: hypothetical protein U0528_02560 [Anaerolineae bacterium]
MPCLRHGQREICQRGALCHLPAREASRRGADRLLQSGEQDIVRRARECFLPPPSGGIGQGDEFAVIVLDHPIDPMTKDRAKPRSKVIKFTILI